jgi:hypothetical protein
MGQGSDLRLGKRMTLFMVVSICFRRVMAACVTQISPVDEYFHKRCIPQLAQRG